MAIALGCLYFIPKVYHYIVEKIQAKTGFFGNECNILERALKSLNVTPQIEIVEDGMKDLTFEFQSFKFIIRNREGSKHSQVFLPYIHNCGLQYYDVVRGLCNYLNGTIPMATLEYNINEKEGNIDIHIVAGLPTIQSKEDMLHTTNLVLNSCIQLRCAFHDQIAMAMAQIGNQQPSDYEYDHACNERGNAILASTDARASEACSDEQTETVADVDSYALASWIERCDVLPKQAVLREIACKSDDGYSFKSTDADTIAAYRIVEPIIHQIGSDQAPTAQTAEIRVTYAYRDPQNKDNKDALEERNHLLVITLERAAVNDSVVYVRINYLLSDRKASSALRAPASESVQPKAGTLTVGFDLKDGKKKKAEFDYMRVDAKDKEKEGKQDEWTEEQKLIHQITNPDVAYNLYWGKKLLLQERYYEATVHLEYVWKWYNEHCTSDAQQQIDDKKFSEICFLLGISYLKLSQYEKAFPYLDYASMIKENLSYQRAFLNCSIAMGNYVLALHFINEELNKLNPYIDQCNINDQEMPSYVSDYYHYLFCCFTNIHIHLKNYEAAETTCKDFLKQNAEDSFALDALARIQRLRGEEGKKEE